MTPLKGAGSRRAKAQPPMLRLADPRLVRVLLADPGLGDGLAPDRFAAAQQQVVAASAALEPWAERTSLDSASTALDPSLLVLGGLLLRQVAIDGRQCSELLGPGDVIRPWDSDPPGLPVEQSLRWRVVKPTRVALLNGRFFDSASPWPEVLGAVVSRAVGRAQSLAAHLTISSMTRIEDRMSLLFWHLAARWGQVTPAGVRVELPLTHELLAELVGAQRPTVTSALARLSSRKALQREGNGSWLLIPAGDPGQGRSDWARG
jgi:hypothetical protein